MACTGEGEGRWMAYVKDQGIFGDQQTIKVAAAWILGLGVRGDMRKADKARASQVPWMPYLEISSCGQPDTRGFPPAARQQGVAPVVRTLSWLWPGSSNSSKSGCQGSPSASAQIKAVHTLCSCKAYLAWPSEDSHMLSLVASQPHKTFHDPTSLPSSPKAPLRQNTCWVDGSCQTSELKPTRAGETQTPSPSYTGQSLWLRGHRSQWVLPRSEAQPRQQLRASGHSPPEKDLAPAMCLALSWVLEQRVKMKMGTLLFYLQVKCTPHYTQMPSFTSPSTVGAHMQISFLSSYTP